MLGCADGAPGRLEARRRRPAALAKRLVAGRVPAAHSSSITFRLSIPRATLCTRGGPRGDRAPRYLKHPNPRARAAATTLTEVDVPAAAPAGPQVEAACCPSGGGEAPGCRPHEADGSPLAVVVAAEAAASLSSSGSTAKMAAAADFVSPFASSFAQHASGSPVQPESPLPQPSHTSRSGSPVRVVGFDSSPNSVVAPRRWQSAALPGSTEARQAAAAMDAAIAAAAGGSSGASGASFPPHQRPALASLERKSSLGTLLRQQDQLNSMQRRLTAINTVRPLTLRKSPPRIQPAAPMPSPCQQAAVQGPPAQGPPTQAAVAQDLEQDWMAALTPSSSELEAAAHAAQAKALAAAAPAAAMPAGPFAAAAAVAFEPSAGTLPAGGGMQRQAPLPPGRPVAAASRQSSMARAGSASIVIPYHTVRRAETAPALTDDIIAAAMAAAGGSAASSAKTAAAAAQAASGSSAGSSYRGSPPKVPLGTLPERQASATREVFEAQAEAVAALTQAKVLQQALAKEQERVERLEQQLRSLMRERAEERARHQAEHQRWMLLQEQQAAYLQQQHLQQAQMQHLQQAGYLQQQQVQPAPVQQLQFPRLQPAAPPPRLAQAPPCFLPAPPPVPGGDRPGATPRMHQPMETWLEETYSQMAVQQMSMEPLAHMPCVPENASADESAAPPPPLQPPAPVRAPPPHRTGLERQQPATLDDLAVALAAMQP